MSQSKYGAIAQIGMVTEDLDASIRHWINTLGVGPWTVFRSVTLAGQYRGQDTVVKMDVAMSYQNDTQVELMQITNGAYSPYLDETGTPLSGLHHLGWMVDDLDATLATAAADGLKIVFFAESPGNRVAYLESPDEKGLLIEHIECPAARQMMTDGIVASRNWDGTNPVHEIDFATM